MAIKPPMSASNTDGWPEFEKDVGLNANTIAVLKAMAKEPRELVWADQQVWRIVADRAGLKVVELARLRDYFDDWARLSVRLPLLPAELASLSQAFPLPSLLLADPDPRAACEKIGLSRIAAAKVVRAAHAARIDDQVVAAVAGTGVGADTPFIEFDSSEGTNGVVWRASGLLDDNDAAIVARIDERERALEDGPIGVRSFEAMLMTDSLLPARPIYLHLGRGELSLVGPICARLPQTVRFVDLSSNRIGVDQFVPLCALLAIVEERRGAVVVWGNPIASSDAQQRLEDLAATKPMQFLRLIWIPQAWLHARHWMWMLGAQAEAMGERVHRAHAKFYNVADRIFANFHICRYL